MNTSQYIPSSSDPCFKTLYQQKLISRTLSAQAPYHNQPWLSLVHGDISYSITAQSRVGTSNKAYGTCPYSLPGVTSALPLWGRQAKGGKRTAKTQQSMFYGAIRTVSRVEAAESTGKPLSYVQPLGAHQTEALAESPRDSSISIHACLSEASRRSSAAVFAVRSTEYSIFFGRRASGAAWFRPWGDDGGWIPRLLCSTEHPGTNSVKDIQKD